MKNLWKKEIDYIITAVKNKTGDDLERATTMFENYIDSDLDKEYGESGETCRTIWNEYKKERELNKSCLELLETVFNEN